MTKRIRSGIRCASFLPSIPSTAPRRWRCPGKLLLFDGIASRPEKRQKTCVRSGDEKLSLGQQWSVLNKDVGVGEEVETRNVQSDCDSSSSVVVDTEAPTEAKKTIPFLVEFIWWMDNNVVTVSSRRPAIFADGNYATQSAASEITVATATMILGSATATGNLRSILLTGDFFLGAVIACTLTKLICVCIGY